MPQKTGLFAFLCFWVVASGQAGDTGSKPKMNRAWNPSAAASYLDGRADWWLGWDKAQRDHDTTCISCHTALPYVLSRGVLSRDLHEKTSPEAEQIMLSNVRSRVTLWNEVQPYYLDA